MRNDKDELRSIVEKLNLDVNKIDELRKLEYELWKDIYDRQKTAYEALIAELDQTIEDLQKQLKDKKNE